MELRDSKRMISTMLGWTKLGVIGFTPVQSHQKRGFINNQFVLLTKTSNDIILWRFHLHSYICEELQIGFPSLNTDVRKMFNVLRMVLTYLN